MARKKQKKLRRYSAAIRLNAVRDLLNSAGGATVYDIAERFKVSVRTANRYLRALEDAGDMLYEERDGRRKVWRLMPTSRRETITLTTSQMVSLFLSKRAFDFLTGTGFKEDLDDIFERLEATLRRKDFLAARHLDRKIYDVNEAPHLYEGRLEEVDDMVTALIKEHRLRVRHVSVERGEQAFLLDPYSLLIYKKGLYLAGHSHHHDAVRTFALDGFREVDWLKGESFRYPDDYHPAQLAEGAFGLIGGPATTVKIFFTDKVARYVTRRLWHPTQEFEKVDGGVEMTMTVRGTVELVSWVLSFGEQVEVLEPSRLRNDIVGVFREALSRHRCSSKGPPSDLAQ